MRKLRQILFATLFITLITACDKDENEAEETIKKETISAKWNVDDSNEYESFEFNESGNYIIVKSTAIKSTNSQTVIFGTYEIINNNTIVLSDFGNLIISQLNDGSINFSIQLTSDPDNETIINASKQEEIDETTKTELLCRTWELSSYDGEDVVGTEYELSVLISKAGTYFVQFADEENDDDPGIANWKWLDDSQTKFLFSWDTPPVWNENNVIEIIELTSDTLKLSEKHDEYNESFYELVPAVNNNKSAQIETNNSLNKQLKVGFLKK